MSPAEWTAHMSVPRQEKAGLAQRLLSNRKGAVAAVERWVSDTDEAAPPAWASACGRSSCATDFRLHPNGMSAQVKNRWHDVLRFSFVKTAAAPV